MKTSLVLTLTALWTAAAESADTPFNLDDVVVSGSRSERPLADTPVRVQLLDEKTIQRLHPRDLKDALRAVPGIQLREIHGKTGSEVHLQGFNGDRVLILVDGLPVSATTGSTVDTSQIATGDIERIEVIPGAASALYGSAAMGGVINIITRTPEKKTGGRISADIGSYGDRQVKQDYGDLRDTFGQRHINGSLSHTIGDTRFRLSADQRQSEGFDLDTDTYPTNGYTGSKTNLQASVSHVTEALRLDFNAERYDEDTETRRLTSGGFEGIKEEDLYRNRAVVHGDWDNLETGSLSFSYLYEQQNDQANQLNVDDNIPGGNLWRDTDYDQQKLSLQQHLLFGELSDTTPVSLTAGLEWFSESMTQDKEEIVLNNSTPADNEVITPRGDGTFLSAIEEVPHEFRQSTEVFTQVSLPLTRSFELSPGVRVQHDSDFGYFTSPSLASRYTFDIEHLTFQFRNSLGIGYRVPNLKNRYFIFDHSVNGYKVLGNPDLEPERSRSFQTSLSLTDNELYHLELSAYHNQITDLIEAQDTGETEDNGRVTLFEYTNFARAMTRGYEIATQFQFSEKLQQRLSYSYLDARDLDLNLPLINRAKNHIKGLWLLALSEDSTLTIIGEYQSGFFTTVSETAKNRTPGFQRWDIKGDVTLNSIFTLYGGIENLFDIVRDPRDPNDRRPLYGRLPYIGITAEF